MPTITLNKKEFEKYLGKKLTPDQLKDRISMIGTDLEEVTETDIHVEVFPKRPDMLSLQGFARALSSFIGNKTGFQKYTVHPSKEKVIVEKPVAKVRPYTACALVKGLKFSDEKIKEVIDIQEKLHITFGRHRKKVAIGIYPLEAIKLPIRFTAKKPEDIVFRPLEADKEMNAKEIIKNHPTGQKYGPLLEGCSTFPVFLDANDEVLSVPPIINSHKTGKITEQTTDVFVECSGHDFELQAKALNMIVTSLADMGGKIYEMQLEYPDKNIKSPDLSPQEMTLDLPAVNKLIGLNLKESEAKQFLERMGHGYHNGTIQIPAYRADILHQVDIAEDIAIAYGYENFQDMIPEVATVAKESPLEVLKNKIGDLLAGCGYQEASTYNLTNDEHQKTKMESKINTIHLANAISEEYNVLRAWLLPTIMEIFSQNKHHEYPQNIFTFGTIFKKNTKTETGIGEEQGLAIGAAHEKADYTEMLQLLDYILRSLGLSYKVKEEQHASFLDGRVSSVFVKDKKIATLGEISPKVLENWELDMPTIAAEINVTSLFSLLQ